MVNVDLLFKRHKACQSVCRAHFLCVMRVMITGSTGQLGGRLLTLSGHPVAWEKELLACGRDLLDLERPETIPGALDRLRPEVVLSCAAYTAVDGAEDEAERAHRINGESPGRLAAACAERGIRLVHISTDYVFDGTGTRPYLPTDPTSPLGVYGASKREGERAILAALPSASIVRVSWLYDRDGKNFLNTMLRLAADRDVLTVVDDQQGCPTHAGHLAEDLLHWVDRMIQDPDRTAGLHHYGHRGLTTWHGFATAILARRAPDVEVRPVPTSAFPTKARRPAYSKLDERPFFEALGRESVTWEAALESCLGPTFPLGTPN